MNQLQHKKVSMKEPWNCSISIYCQSVQSVQSSDRRWILILILKNTKMTRSILYGIFFFQYTSKGIYFIILFYLSSTENLNYIIYTHTWNTTLQTCYEIHIMHELLISSKYWMLVIHLAWTLSLLSSFF